MYSSFKDFFSAHPLRQTKQWLSWFSFGLFILMLEINLSVGNSFIALAEVEQNSVKPELELEATKVYQPLVAAVQTAYESQWQELETARNNQRGENKVGVYIHMHNMANQRFLKSEITTLKNFANSSIIFDVKGSFVYFPTTSPIAKEYGLVKPLYDLPNIIAQLRAAGIYSIARVIAVKDSEFYWRNSKVALKNPLTGAGVAEWVDPANPEVLQYNREVISEILDAGVDEINLDFIRYPDKVTSNFLGITQQKKIANIENFVKMVREVVDSKPQKAILSIDTFAIVGLDFQANAGPLGQDVKVLAPYVDIIAPMLYPSTFGLETVYYDPQVDKGGRSYTLVKKTLEAYTALLGPEQSHKLRPWIQGYYMETVDLVRQIQGVYDAGYCGFLVWNIFNDYAPTYEAMRTVEVPASCKKD